LAGRKRDEKGRVLPKEPEPEVAEEPTPPESKPEPKEPQSIPLTVLLEEREKRQNEQRQREQLQQQLWALQQRLQAQEKPPEPVDMFADPQAWEQSQQQKNESWRKQVMGEMSLRLAKANHKDVFDDAYVAMQQRFQSGDEALKQQFVASPDPGEMMVNWYNREKTLATVGPDPESFLARALDAALENPEFLARAVEKARGVASTKPSQTKLPPSLSKATASSNSGESVSGMSDEELFKESWR
jgi:hypothetical protein